MRKVFAFAAVVLTTSAGLITAQAPPPVDLPGSDSVVSAPAEAPPARFRVDAEYLLWWVKNGPVPAPLVTTGSLSDPRPGAVGMPGTAVLYGNSGIDYKAHSGGRLTGDWWLDDDQRIGVEGVGFITETHTTHFGLDSDHGGAPVVARPFLNAATGLSDAQVVTAPATFLGGIDVFSDSRFWGSEANLLVGLYRGEGFRADLLAGFRYLALDENIRISQSSTLLAQGHAGFFGTAVPAPDIVSITDRFNTGNEFYGGQIGVRGEYRLGRWRVGFVGKAAVGSNYETYRVFGVTQMTDSAGKTLTGPGGLYALASNSGVSHQDRIAFAPEVGVRFGYQIASGVSLHVGYSLLYWDDAARPGDEINPRIDPRQVPSSLLFQPTALATQPTRLTGQSDYWAQGLTCGLEFQF